MERESNFDNSEILPKYAVEGREIPEWIVSEAFLINEALDKKVVTKEEAEKGLEGDREILDMMRKMVDVRYFVEYPVENVEPEKRGEKILELFKQKVNVGGKEKELADFLAEHRQGVSLAMSTLDDETAKAVRHLNKKGVPVVGWVVVDDIEGYWTNPANVSETAQKTEAIRQWAKENDLQLTALGFDLEKPLPYIKALSRGNIIETVKQIRSYRAKVRERSKEGDPEKQFYDLLLGLKEEGVETEIYAEPKGTKWLLGGMDVRCADRFVEMVYTSTLPGVIRKGGANSMRSRGAIPALGIVSGKETETPGRDLLGKLPRHLTQEELENDIGRVLDRELNLGNREFSLRNLYLYALNDARVALMMEQAMEKSFSSRLEK